MVTVAAAAAWNKCANPGADTSTIAGERGLSK
jgi:hypothetical protein